MTSRSPLIPALLGAMLLCPSFTQAADLTPSLSASNLSLRNEVQHAIDKGLSWLAANQNSNGYWSTADHPAVTALALNAFMGEPTERARTNPVVQKGYKYILGNVQPDGGIYAKDLPNYNTSISMMALIAAHNPAYDPIVLNARHWIIGEQSVLTNSPFDGGVGYGSDKQHHSDMNNTLVALEALYYSQYLEKDKASGKDLNWGAAINFIQNCQNLPGTNQQTWVSTNIADRGGFIYSPDQSKAGAQTTADGRIALRSYGSISYAGMLSYVYADLKRDDPRVTAVYNWLQSNATLDENPGMSQEGYYYYLHLMAKGLSTYGANELELKDGKKLDWRKELALKLINLEKTDGSWANPVGRWWEKDPALVTAYSVMALEFIYRGL